MAIKYDNKSVNNITYNSQTVKKLVLDNEVKWEKPFVLSESKAPGCSVSYNRTSTNEPSAKTGTISAGTIYNEDVIKITYSPSTYYVIDTFTVNGASFTSGNSITVSGNVSVVCTTKGVAQTITVTKNTGVAKINVTYVNIYGTQTTVSFTASGSITDAWQSTNYSWDATAETGYTMTSSAGSGTVGTSTTIAPTASLNSYTITWKYLTAYPNTWGTTQQTYSYGDTPSRSAAATVTNTSNNERKTFNSWNNLAPVTANRTIEAVYNQEYYITCSGTRCTSSSSSWKADGATFTATWSSSTNCAFNAAGTQTSATQSITVSGAPATYTKSADYIYVTIGGSNNASIVKYGTTTAASTGWHSYNQRLTYNPATYYSYAVGTTQTSKSDVYLTTPGGTYSYSPTYIKAASIATGTYNASVNRNASTYYATGTTIVWSANNTHSYGGSAVSDNSSPVTLTAGGTFSAPTPGYTKITVTATRSTIKVGSTARDSGWSGIVANGTTITWTASTNYSFAAGTTQDATRTADVAVSTLTYAKSADYKNITVTGTHCSSNIATGYRHLGDTIVWTGSSGTNYKYGFSSSDHTATTNSAAGTNAGVISTDYASYTNTAGYLWYNITSITGTHCTAYTNDSYNTQYTTGWHLSTANIYWKITTTGYCFDQNSNSQTDTKAPVAGDNSRTTNLLCRYVLTISVTNPSYGSYSVKRGTTVLNNGDYIYYGDALTGTHSQNPDSGTSWNPWPTVTAPSATTTGAATSGNLTVKNEDSATCTLYYNTTNSTTGATSLGSVAAGATKYKDGLSFNTTYYLFATKSITRTGSHYTYSDSSTYSGTASVTGNVTATFAFGRTTVSDSESKTGYSSITSKATAAQTYYTITFNRARQDANGCQSLATAVADTSIGVASVSVPYGGSYSETFSKTNFTSQTKSGSNVTASATVNVTLVPVTYSLGASLTQWTGGWYTNSSYTGSTISWMYHGNTAYFRATPNSRYGQTVSNVWYYNGKYYSTTTTSAASSVSLSATAIVYTVTASLTNAAVTLGTSTSSYSVSLSKTYAELYTNNPNIYFKITPNVHYGMTIGSIWYYNGNPLSGSSYYITGNSFSFSDANKTATYGLSSTTYPVSAITYTVSGGTSANGSVSWTNNTYGNNATWTITPNTGYNAPSPATGNKAVTTDNFTISDANKTAVYKGGAFDPCVIKSYTITVTGSNCTITVGGTTRASGWSGTVNHFTEIKWTPTTYYSFDTGSTQTSKTATVTGAGTYSNSPTAVRAASIATGTYNASVNRNASTYYAANTVVTWTAGSNYSYGGSTTGDTTTNGDTKVTAGATIAAPNPGYVKCTISGTRCAANKTTNTIYAVNTQITWTANDNYSFASGSSRTATSTAGTNQGKVALAYTSYTHSADYGLYTVNAAPSHTTKNVSTGYYALTSKTTRYTADTGWYWNASGTNYKDVAGTPPCTITAPAAPTYCAITTGGTNCTASPSYTTSTIVANGTTISFTSNTNYSASSGSTQTNPSSQTVSGPGSYTATAQYAKFTKGTLTNCSTTWTSGNYYKLYAYDNTSKVPFTSSDSTRYAFDSSGTSSATTNFTAPGTYDKAASYKRLNITYTNCSKANAGAANGWYTDSSKTVAATGNTGWYFTSSSQSYSSSHTLPAITTISPTYVLIKKGTCSNCSSVKVGSTDVTASGIVARLTSSDSSSKVTYTAATNYSWAAGTSRTATTTTNITAPATVNQSPGYGYWNITYTNCVKNSGTDNGYRDVNTAISATAKANSGWSFGGSTAQDTKVTNGGTAIKPPYSETLSPTYFYVTTSKGTGVASVTASGFHNSATTITSTASSGYAFDSSGTTTKSTTGITSPTTVSHNCTHGYLTVPATGLNCAATSGTTTSGWKAFGNYTANYTANTNYAFDSSGTTTKDSAAVSVPGTITPPTVTHGYLTITPTLCGSYADSACTIHLASGWKPVGSFGTIYWKANANYSFGGSTAQDTTSTANVTCPGTYSMSPSYAYITVTCTSGHSTIMVGSAGKISGWSGFAQIGSAIKWTADTGYGYSVGLSALSTLYQTNINSATSYSDPALAYVKITYSAWGGQTLTVQKKNKAVWETATEETIIIPRGETGWYAYGQTYRVLGTADTNYSYSEGTTRQVNKYWPSSSGTTNTISVALITTQVYAAVTFSLTRCTATVESYGAVSSGTYYLDNITATLSDFATATATSGYAFNNSGTTTSSVSDHPGAGGTITFSADYVQITFANGNYHQWNATSTVWVKYNTPIIKNGDEFALITDSVSNPTIRTVSEKSTNPPYYIYRYTVNSTLNVTAARTLTITSSRQEPSQWISFSIIGNWLAKAPAECTHTGVFNSELSPDFNVNGEAFDCDEGVTTNNVLTFKGVNVTNTASSNSNYGLQVSSNGWGSSLQSSQIKFNDPAISGLSIASYTVKIRDASSPAQVWATYTINSTSSVTHTVTREQAYKRLFIEITVDYRVEVIDMHILFKNGDAMWHQCPTPTPDWTNYTPQESITCGGYEYWWYYIPVFIKYVYDNNYKGFIMINPYTGQATRLYARNVQNSSFSLYYYGAGTATLPSVPSSMYDIWGLKPANGILYITGN